MNAQLKSIIAHITIFGWLIALMLNSTDKEEMASFYIRQTLGIYLLGIIGIYVIGRIIPGISLIIALVTLALWVVSLIGAIRKENMEVPVLGKLFQKWFDGIS